MLARTFVLRDEPHCRQLYAFLKAYWLACAQSHRPLAVVVTEAKSKRSIDQNKRYWALLNEIAQAVWVGGRQFPADVWHAEFAGRLIGWSETPSGGRVPISTTTLGVADFSAYMDKIEAIAADELGIEIGAVT